MHISIILDGVEYPIKHGGDGGDFAAEQPVDHSHGSHEVRDYRVIETPERMREFEKMVEKFCKKGE